MMRPASFPARAMQTRSSVIQRAKAGDAGDLARIYGPLVFAQARRLGLREDEAEEVMQQVLLKLLEKLPGFAYDRSKGSFKGLLKKIVREQAIDLGRRQRARVEVPESLAAPEQDLDAAFEREWLQAHLETALDRVRNEVKPTTFQAFDLLVLKEWPVARVAEFLGQTPNHLAQSKRRVLQRLRAQLEELLHEG
jgi:RNA polymerase sigma-70 factor (ECF subfamily)